VQLERRGGGLIDVLAFPAKGNCMSFGNMHVNASSAAERTARNACVGGQDVLSRYMGLRICQIHMYVYFGCPCETGSRSFVLP